MRISYSLLKLSTYFSMCKQSLILSTDPTAHELMGISPNPSSTSRGNVSWGKKPVNQCWSSSFRHVLCTTRLVFDRVPFPQSSVATLLTAAHLYRNKF